MEALSLVEGGWGGVWGYVFEVGVFLFFFMDLIGLELGPDVINNYGDGYDGKDNEYGWEFFFFELIFWCHGLLSVERGRFLTLAKRPLIYSSL